MGTAANVPVDAMKMNAKERRELMKFARQATKGQSSSAQFLCGWSDKIAEDPGSDPMYVFQLGYALILGKPISVVAAIGSNIPENLQRVAAAVEFYIAGDGPSFRKAVERATRAAAKKAGVELPPEVH